MVEDNLKGENMEKFDLDLSKPLSEKDKLELLKLKLEEATIRKDFKVAELIKQEIEEFLKKEETTSKTM